MHSCDLDDKIVAVNNQETITRVTRVTMMRYPSRNEIKTVVLLMSIKQKDTYFIRCHHRLNNVA